MRSRYLGAMMIVLGAVASGCGSSEKDAGAEACGLYRDAVAESPEVIAPFDTLPEIKETLSELDAPTRRAFADLVTAADASGMDPSATEEAAAEVRSTCMAEHGIEIPN